MAADDLYFTISTAGHVDHGKTSLLKKLTGIDPDRLKEEKQRQMTTDLGFAHLKMPAPIGTNAQFCLGFIDVPGHGKFLKNMIAGVGALDMALLIVAADEGPMPQTLQHMEILSLLSVKKILLVITKRDLVEEEKIKSVIASMKKLIQEYDLEMLDAIPVSVNSDQDIDQLKEALGLNLAKLSSRTISNYSNCSIFLPIDRAFNIVGHGLVITGTLVSGKVKPGDTVWIEPAGVQARVRGLETFGNQIQLANPGQRLAINLSLKEQAKIERGQSIVGVPTMSTKTLIVVMRRFCKDVSQKSGIRSQPIRLYLGTAEISGTLAWSDQLGEIEKAQQSFLAQINLEEVAVAAPSEKFLLRYGENGIAGGQVLLKTRPNWLNRKQLLEFSHLLINKQFEEGVVWFVQNSPQKLINKNNLDQFLPIEVIEPVLQSVLNKKRLIEIGDFLLTEEYHARLKDHILQELTKLESNKTDKLSGIALEEIRTSIKPLPEKIVFDSLIELLSNQGSLARQTDKIFSSEAKKKAETFIVDPKYLADIEQVLSKNVCIEITALSDQCKINSTKITQILNALEKEGKVKRVAHEFVCSSKSIATAHQILSEIWQEKGDISPSDFKERLNISRKYAMPMLAYFDDALITRRLPKGRMLLKQPKS